MELFKDHSIFQDIVQYFDTFKNEWRREEDAFQYRFFKSTGGDYIYQGNLIKKGIYTTNIESIHYKFITNDFEEEEN